jgi:hypothetical protein
MCFATFGNAETGAGNEIRWTVGANVLQPILGMVIAQSISNSTDKEGSHALYPFVFEVKKRHNDKVSFGGTLVYEYFVDGTQMYTHETAIGFSSRYSFSAKGIEGWYVEIALGPSFSWGQNYDGDKYKRFAILSMPQIGYAVCFGRPGFYLSSGLGMRSFFGVGEWPDRIDWNSYGRFARHLLPVFNCTLGFGSL